MYHAPGATLGEADRNSERGREPSRVQYRKYGADGPEVSTLTFGAMRLPPRRQGERWGKVSLAKAAALIRRAMDAGVNLIDSHHFYHGGDSERAIGRALKGWKGQRVYVQTKTPFYQPQKLGYFQRLIEEALEKTGLNCIDYLLHHSMGMDTFKKKGRQYFKLTDWAMKRGYVQRRGFSSHDTPEHVKAFVDTGEFSAMVVSYNWLNPAIADTIAYAAGKGMGVAVMNPVGGGSLAADTREILRLVRGAKTGAEVALRYVLATPGVTTAMSGMSTPEQVDENVAVAGRGTHLTDKQRKQFRRRLDSIRRRGVLICAACGYCMPCSHGVDIPGNFTLLNRAKLLGLRAFAAGRFANMRRNKDGDKSALACKRCGQCLSKCPNDVPIIEQLAEAAELLASS